MLVSISIAHCNYTVTKASIVINNAAHIVNDKKIHYEVFHKKMQIHTKNSIQITRSFGNEHDKPTSYKCRAFSVFCDQKTVTCISLTTI